MTYIKTNTIIIPYQRISKVHELFPTSLRSTRVSFLYQSSTQQSDISGFNKKNTKVATVRLKKKKTFFWESHLQLTLGFLDPKELNPRESKNIDEWVASEMIMATWVKRNPKTIKSGFSWSREQNTQNKKREVFCGSIMMHQRNFWETRPQIHVKLWCFMKLKSSRGGGFHRPKS